MLTRRVADDQAAPPATNRLRRRQFIIGGVGFLLLLGVLVGIVLAGRGQPAAPPVSAVPPDEPVVAVALVDVLRLPDYLTAPLLASQPPVALDAAATAPLDAVLLSRQTLVEATSDPQLRTALTNLVANGKMLLVHNASTSEVIQVLNAGGVLPADRAIQGMEIAAVVRDVNGGMATGILLVSADRDPRVATTWNSVRDYVAYLKAAVRDNQATATP